MIEKQIILKNHLVNYYAVESEPAAAKTAIFLHGWRANAMIWMPVVKQMSAADFNIYSLDLPGFGKSESPKEPWHLADYARVVGQFIEKLALKKPIVVGHSFGGRVAVKFASLYPGAASKLVLVSCGGFRKVEWKRSLTTFFAKLLGPAFALPLLRTLRPRIYNILGAEDYLAIPELKSTFINVINEDVLKLAPSVQNTTLIIWGQDDQEVPLELGKHLNSLISKSKLTVYANSGHFPFLDKPDEFTKELISFLKD